MSGSAGGIKVIGNTRDAFCEVNPHCLDSIVQLSDEMPVLASSDIYDDRGIKLWAKGAPVSKSLQEKMLRRRLQKPLEVSLDVEGGATLECVVGDCFELMKRTPALELVAGTSTAKSILRGMRNTKLPPPLKLLLTSARQQKKRGYDISLAGMVVCSGLSAGIGLSDHEAGLLILSALVHDIGEMYINPEYLDSSRQLEPAEWKHVASHPCVGQAFLKEFTSFPPAVADCVLHHHERMDGSGYPFQVAGTNMSNLVKLICVADSAAAVIMRGGAGLRERVAVALRIMPEEFPRPAVGYINNALSSLETGEMPPEAGSFAERVLPTLQQLRAARMLSEELASKSPTPRLAATGKFALENLISIDKNLRSTGVYELAQLEVLESDAVIMGEVCLVLKEVSWRLRNLARNIYLRTEQGGDGSEIAKVVELVAALNQAPRPIAIH